MEDSQRSYKVKFNKNKKLFLLVHYYNLLPNTAPIGSINFEYSYYTNGGENILSYTELNKIPCVNWVTQQIQLINSIINLPILKVVF